MTPANNKFDRLLRGLLAVLVLSAVGCSDREQPDYQVQAMISEDPDDADTNRSPGH